MSSGIFTKNVKVCSLFLEKLLTKSKKELSLNFHLTQDSDICGVILLPTRKVKNKTINE